VAKDRRGTWKRRCRILAFSGPADPPKTMHSMDVRWIGKW
jgi:hypothetical protein